MRPVCVPCETEMLCSKTGRRVMLFDSNDQPYLVHAGDEFECPTCKTRVVQGFARAPLAEHWQPGFVRFLAEFTALAMNPYRRYVRCGPVSQARLPEDPDQAIAALPLTKLQILESWLGAFLAFVENLGPANIGDDEALAVHIGFAYQRLGKTPPKAIASWLAEAELALEHDNESRREPDPREKGDDDGREYGHPRDAREERLR